MKKTSKKEKLAPVPTIKIHVHNYKITILRDQTYANCIMRMVAPEGYFIIHRASTLEIFGEAVKVDIEEGPTLRNYCKTLVENVEYSLYKDLVQKGLTIQ